jgi:hypothetical protein
MQAGRTFSAKEVLLTVNHFFAGIAVADYGAALDWYQRFFGRSPDVVVSENEAMWQVVEKSWVYVVSDATRAGKALLTLLVDDLETQIAELAERRLAPAAIEAAPGVPRKAVFIDPEGNMLSFGENPSTSR